MTIAGQYREGDDWRELAVTCRLSAQQRLFRILREHPAEGRFEAMHRFRLTPLVGRDEEIGLLLSRWALARNGAGQVVVLWVAVYLRRYFTWSGLRFGSSCKRSATAPATTGAAIEVPDIMK